MSARSELLFVEIARLESLIEEAKKSGDNVSGLEADLVARKAELNEVTNLMSQNRVLKG